MALQYLPQIVREMNKRDKQDSLKSIESIVYDPTVEDYRETFSDEQSRICYDNEINLAIGVAV